MQILTITGDHPRHLYYINQIHKRFPLAGAVLWEREHLVPEPPSMISQEDHDNFVTHFANRDEAEARYFSTQKRPNCPIHIATDDLNSQRTVKFLEKIKPDVVLIFGSGLITEPVVSALPACTINMHLGLSPRYRGAATLFWPFYCMEPAYAGATFHYIVAEPDAGDIIHQVVPKLERTDRIHDVACKTVVTAAADMVRILELRAAGKKLKKHRQRSTGKNFLGKDFRPEHLRVNYTLFKDEMVRAYLDGEIAQKKPRLFTQFE